MDLEFPQVLSWKTVKSQKEQSCTAHACEHTEHRVMPQEIPSCPLSCSPHPAMICPLAPRYPQPLNPHNFRSMRTTRSQPVVHDPYPLLFVLRSSWAFPFQKPLQLLQLQVLKFYHPLLTTTASRASHLPTFLMSRLPLPPLADFESSNHAISLQSASFSGFGSFPSSKKAHSRGNHFPTTGGERQAAACPPATLHYKTPSGPSLTGHLLHLLIPSGQECTAS